jgi:hypothetical protein
LRIALAPSRLSRETGRGAALHDERLWIILRCDFRALAEALDAGANAIAQGEPADEVAAAFDDAAAATNQALRAVVGDAAEESSYKGSVIAALLSTAAHEYEEAVGEKECGCWPSSTSMRTDGSASLANAMALSASFSRRSSVASNTAATD